MGRSGQGGEAKFAIDYETLNMNPLTFPPSAAEVGWSV